MNKSFKTEEESIQYLAKKLAVARVGAGLGADVTAQDYLASVVAHNHFAKAESEAPVAAEWTAATAPVGAKFEATELTYNGLRLMTKVGPDRWTDKFYYSGKVYDGVNNYQAQGIFDSRDGKWMAG